MLQIRIKTLANRRLLKESLLPPKDGCTLEAIDKKKEIGSVGGVEAK